MTHIEATATFNGCLKLFLSESEDCLGLAWYDVGKASAKCPAEGVGEWTMGELLAIAERHGVEIEVSYANDNSLS